MRKLNIETQQVLAIFENQNKRKDINKSIKFVVGLTTLTTTLSLYWKELTEFITNISNPIFFLQLFPLLMILPLIFFAFNTLRNGY